MIQEPGIYVYAGEAPELIEESKQWEDAERIHFDLDAPGPLPQLLRRADLGLLGTLSVANGAVEATLKGLAEKQMPMLRTLRITSLPDFPVSMSRLDRLKWLGQLDTLSLTGLGLRGGVGEELAAMRRLEGLRKLSLNNLRLSPTGLASMVIAPHLSRLQTLKLSAVGLTDHAGIVLSNSLLLRHVERLDLSDNPDFRDIGVVRLLSRPRPNIQILSLADTNVSSDITPMLCSAVTLPRLVRLDLSGNIDFGDGGLFSLTQADFIQRVEILKLDAAGIGDPGVLALAESHAHMLRTLTLRGRTNPITDEGALALIRSPNLRALERLEIHPHHLTDEGRIWLLVEAPDGLEGLSAVKRMLSRRALLRFAQRHRMQGIHQLGRGRLLTLLRARLSARGRERSSSTDTRTNYP
ncbi:MAG: hypothetical protein AAFV53_15500 [Myxococcota bacterium]